jgi:hypothetical protein
LTRPWNDSYRDIARKQTDKNGRFLVGHEAGQLVAKIMVGYVGIAAASIIWSSIRSFWDMILAACWCRRLKSF